MGVAALLIGVVLGHNAWCDFRFDAEAVLVGFGGAAAMLLVFGSAWRLPFESIRRIEAKIEAALRPLLETCTAGQLALLSIAAGFGEELLFRGLIQGMLNEATGYYTAVLLSALLFGLAHPITPAYVVFASVMGVFLSWTWQLSGNLLTPIVAHSAYDFVALLFLLRTRRSFHSTNHLQG